MEVFSLEDDDSGLFLTQRDPIDKDTGRERLI